MIWLRVRRDCVRFRPRPAKSSRLQYQQLDDNERLCFFPSSGLFFLILMPFSVHTVDLRLRKATSDEPHAVVRSLRFALPPLHQPSATRVAESNTNPSPPALASPSPLRPAWSAASLNPGPRHRKTRARRKLGASTGATAGGSRRAAAAAGEGSAAPARRRRRRERGGQTQPRAKRARRQRGGDGGGQRAGRHSRGRKECGASAGATAAGNGRADTAAGEESAAPARGRRRRATGGQTQPRAKRARRQRGGDGGGQRVGRHSLGRRERGPSAGATAAGNGWADAAAGELGCPAWAARPHLRAAPTSEPEPNALRSVSANGTHRMYMASMTVRQRNKNILCEN